MTHATRTPWSAFSGSRRPFGAIGGADDDAPVDLHDAFLGGAQGFSARLTRRTAANATTGGATNTANHGAATIIAIIDNRAGEVGIASCCLHSLGITLTQFCDTASFSKTLAFVFAHAPIEVLVSDNTGAADGKLTKTLMRHFGDTTNFTAVPRGSFNEARGAVRLLELLSTADAAADVTSTDRYLCVAAGNALVANMERAHGFTLLPNTVRVRYVGLDKHVELNRATAAALRLLPADSSSSFFSQQQHQQQRRKHPGATVAAIPGGETVVVAAIFAPSLVQAIDYTSTPMGRRFLRANVLQPLRDVAALDLRFDAVALLAGTPSTTASASAVVPAEASKDAARAANAMLLLSTLRAGLRTLGGRDLERIVSVFSHQPPRRTLRVAQATIDVTLALRVSLAAVVQIRDALAHAAGAATLLAATPVAAADDDNAAASPTSDGATRLPAFPALLLTILEALQRCDVEEIIARISTFLDDDVAAAAAGGASPTAAAAAAALPPQQHASGGGGGGGRKASGAVLQVQQCFAVKPGVSGVLDLARHKYSEAIEAIFSHCDELRAAYAIPSLKVTFDAQREYFFTFAAMHDAHADPSVFVQKYHPGAAAAAMGSAAAGKRVVQCTTRQLLVLRSAAADAVAEIMSEQDAIIQSLLVFVRERLSRLQALCDAVSLLDVLVSHALFARAQHAQRPRVDADYPIFVPGARHPAAPLSGTAQPNTVDLSLAKPLVVLTGPNASGKSTFLRQVGQIAILAHIGCFLPVANAGGPTPLVRLLDRIVARMPPDAAPIAFGAAAAPTSSADTMAGSCFVGEMRDLAAICLQTTRDTLVLLDELGRSTNACEGEAIAWAAAEWLADLRCPAVFATHFPRLTQLAACHAAVANQHLAVVTAPRAAADGSGATPFSMRFLFRVAPGPCEVQRYGIALASRLGIDRDVLDRIPAILAALDRARDDDAAAAATAGVGVGDGSDCSQPAAGDDFDDAALRREILLLCERGDAVGLRALQCALQDGGDVKAATLAAPPLAPPEPIAPPAAVCPASPRAAAHGFLDEALTFFET